MEDRRSFYYKGKSRAGIYFARSLEIIAIAMVYLERSRAARFIAAKLSMSTVVEVTSHFGAKAGHRLSTVLALFVAEPKLLAVLITGILIAVNLVLWLLGMFLHRSHHPRRHGGRPPVHGKACGYKDLPEEDFQKEPLPAGAWQEPDHYSDAADPPPRSPELPRRTFRPGFFSLPAFILCLSAICVLLYFFG